VCVFTLAAFPNSFPPTSRVFGARPARRTFPPSRRGNDQTHTPQLVWTKNLSKMLRFSELDSLDSAAEWIDPFTFDRQARKSSASVSCRIHRQFYWCAGGSWCRSSADLSFIFSTARRRCGSGIRRYYVVRGPGRAWIDSRRTSKPQGKNPERSALRPVNRRRADY